MRTERRRPLWVYWVLAFVVLQLLDGVLTSVGMHRYGLDLEANPIAAYTFAKWGVLTGVILAKAISFVVFFGMLWYCLRVRWTVLDVVGLLWGREPKKDPAYAMLNFHILAVITLLGSLYAGGGWIYVLLYLGGVS